jgi:hypothetical protein
MPVIIASPMPVLRVCSESSVLSAA